METTLELASPSLPCYPGRHSELGTAQQSVITTAIIRNIYYREIMPVQCLKWQQKNMVTDYKYWQIRYSDIQLKG